MLHAQVCGIRIGRATSPHGQVHDLQAVRKQPLLLVLVRTQPDANRRAWSAVRLPEHRIAQAVWLPAEATAATRPGGPAAQPYARAVTSAVASLEGDRHAG